MRYSCYLANLSPRLDALLTPQTSTPPSQRDPLHPHIPSLHPPSSNPPQSARDIVLLPGCQRFLNGGKSNK
ncbi:hypothetical protein RTBOTA2_004533 [Rhodotorula toruloides]|nr:hypothetical protein RTBOTA2_004533 [Rhodotorula toruloides]